MPPRVAPALASVTPDRLYAFPRVPDPPTGLLLLDSGAYGLSLQKRTMNHRYLADLARYYAQHGQGAYCVAPDALLEPERTMRQWRLWHTHIPEHTGQPAPRIYPVLQMRQRHEIDLVAAERQIAFYGEQEVVFWANPFLTALAARRQGFERLLEMVRQGMKCRHVHVLGAGWNPHDIAAWAEMGVESIDSIAWYEDAQAGKVWLPTGAIAYRPELPLRERLVMNACVAAAFAQGFTRHFSF